MIFLFTDFGVQDPYVGQLHAVLAREAPATPVIDLFHNAPCFNIQASAYLLAALFGQIPAAGVVLAVVDPGVGGDRPPVILQVDGRWIVGPDNGLFTLVSRRSRSLECHRITWQPAVLSPSFHGRDLFAPVVAQLAQGQLPAREPHHLTANSQWPDDLPRIVYVDHYGNLMTGLRGECLTSAQVLFAGNRALQHARVFVDARPQDPFWYVNSIGLVEIAVAQGSAAERLELNVGDPVGTTGSSSGYLES